MCKNDIESFLPCQSFHTHNNYALLHHGILILEASLSMNHSYYYGQFDITEVTRYQII